MAKQCGVFYFWGHSYEMITDSMWSTFEETIERISADPDSCWGEVADLFENETSTMLARDKRNAGA